MSSDGRTGSPTICLNMIVRNESHIVREVLDAVSSYITSWVIVDTGSTDGTQDVIRNHMAGLGIPGELHERPWRDFGHNRTEALRLAQGNADYIWVIDADDTIDGTIEFTDLTADAYRLRFQGQVSYWRRQLFRDGVPWRYVGVVHEHAVCDDAFVEKRLEGDYFVHSRRLGARNADPEKYARDRDLLLAEVERNPDDTRSIFYLAQSYFDLGQFAEARKWYMLRAQRGGWGEEVYYAMYRVAVSTARLGAPWAAVMDAYLRAWEFRPTRAEPLHAIASQCRKDRRYALCYLFAEQAARIPLPEQDSLFVSRDIYAWRALDEQAISAYWVGKRTESFHLCRKLLARHDLPSRDRRRIGVNRDFAVPALTDAASAYRPEFADIPLGDQSTNAAVTVCLVAGPDRAITEQTLNSFLHSCIDVARVGRFLVIDAGLSAEDREIVRTRYPCVDIHGMQLDDDPDVRLAQIRREVRGRFWLHLGQGWRFFAAEKFIGRLTTVLDTEPRVVQVGINFQDALSLTAASAEESGARRTPDNDRYVITHALSRGPAMFDTGRFDRAGGAELEAATLDEVLCISRSPGP